MEDKKSIIIIVILALLVFGLGGFIVYDKFFSKKEEDNTLTTINSTSIDLNAFYQIGDILDSFDTAFNNPNTSYFGYIYTSKKLMASSFDMGAAIYASMVQDMVGTAGAIARIPEAKIKGNFEKIFGKNLTYKNSEVNSGETYKVAYDEAGKRYAYFAPIVMDVYTPSYVTVNIKTVLEENKIIITRKLFYVEYTIDPSTGEATTATIYKAANKQEKIGTMELKNGKINTKELTSKFGSKMNTYQYVFNEYKTNEYSFESIEIVK